MTLNDIGLTCHTDKSSSFHDYLRVYEAMLGDRKDSFRGILEIGVYAGGSLRMWKQWCPQAFVVGIDNWKDHPPVQVEGCVVRTIDAGNEGMLRSLGEELGPFDLIVDDGSHDLGHQRISFQALWPFVAEGGYYIIEDIPDNEQRFSGMLRLDGAGGYHCAYLVKNASARS